MAMTSSALEFLQGLFVGDETAQKEYQSDPQGTLESHGLADCEPAEINQAVAQIAPGLSGDAQVRANAYLGSTQGQGGYNNGGGGASHAARGAAQMEPGAYGTDPPPSAAGASAQLQAVMTEINYITQVTQVDVNQVNNFTDNSLKQFIVAGGDVTTTVDNDTITASGDGAVAGAGDLSGIATGAGAVAAGEDIQNAQVNTGTNTGIIAENANNAIVGDGNVSVDTGGGSLENVGIGDGNTQNIVDVGSGATVEGVNFGDGGVVNTGDDNVGVGQGNQVAQGNEAVSFGSGDATNVDAQNANVGGTQVVDQSTTTTDASTNITTTNTDSFNTDASVTTTDNSINDSQNQDNSTDASVTEIDTIDQSGDGNAAFSEPPADPADA